MTVTIDALMTTSVNFNAVKNTDNLSGQNESGNSQPGETAGMEKTASAEPKLLNNNNVRYRVDVDSKRAILQITDPETGEVIKTIPSEEMLKVLERVEKVRCQLVDCAG